VGSELIPAFGRTLLRDLSPLEIQAFLSRSLARNCHERERQLSAQTVRHFFQVLKRALNQAARWELIVRNPCQLVDPPRVRSPEMKVLDEEGLQKLLSAAQGSRLHPVIFLAATTGMRRGELLALRWSDLDTATGECRVCRSLEERESGLGYKSPKTRKGRRVVVLPKAALAQLKTHRAKQGKERLLLGAGYKDEDLIFARADGSPWPPSQFSSEFARLARKHGIRIRFHDLRHTHATHLLKAGVPVRVVSERLGHAAASITLDVYAHVLPGQQQEAVAKVDAMLGRMAAGEVAGVSRFPLRGQHCARPHQDESSLPWPRATS
jgi:integrase